MMAERPWVLLAAHDLRTALLLLLSGENHSVALAVSSKREERILV